MSPLGRNIYFFVIGTFFGMYISKTIGVPLLMGKAKEVVESYKKPRNGKDKD